MQQKPDEYDFGPKVSFDGMSFEEKIKMFMQDSDEKISTLRRNMDSKRGGGGYRRSSANV